MRPCSPSHGRTLMNSLVLQRRKAKSPRRRKRAKGQRGTRTSARGHEDRLRHGCNDWSGVVHIPAMGAPSKASAWGANRRHVSLAAETRIHHHHVSCGCELRRRFHAAVRPYGFVCVRRYSERPARSLLAGGKCAARTGDKTWHCKTTRRRSSDLSTRLYAQQPHLHSRGALCASTDHHRPRVL